MTQNPYKSESIGLTMNDVRIKICKELELASIDVMEMLVDNNIISPSLPIELVWRRIWLKKHKSLCDSGLVLHKLARALPPMKIIYRLIGLDGEATETLIDTLEEEKEDEGEE